MQSSCLPRITTFDQAITVNGTIVISRATENRFFAGPNRFLVCKTVSVYIKSIFFGPKKKQHTLRIIYWPNYLD